MSNIHSKKFRLIYNLSTPYEENVDELCEFLKLIRFLNHFWNGIFLFGLFVRKEKEWITDFVS